MRRAEASTSSTRPTGGFTIAGSARTMGSRRNNCTWGGPPDIPAEADPSLPAGLRTARTIQRGGWSGRDHRRCAAWSTPSRPHHVRSPRSGLGRVFVVNPLPAVPRFGGKAPSTATRPARHRQPFTDLVTKASSCQPPPAQGDEIGAGCDRTAESDAVVRWSGGFDSLHGFRLRSALHHVELFADYLLG